MLIRLYFLLSGTTASAGVSSSGPLGVEVMGAAADRSSAAKMPLGAFTRATTKARTQLPQTQSLV